MSNEAPETPDGDSGQPSAADPPAAVCPPMPLATSFTLAGYGRVRDGDLVDQEELVADAYGMLLPDGRVVTYSDTHSGDDPELRLWPDLTDAADYWGSCVLWAAT